MLAKKSSFLIFLMGLLVALVQGLDRVQAHVFIVLFQQFGDKGADRFLLDEKKLTEAGFDLLQSLKKPLRRQVIFSSFKSR